MATPDTNDKVNQVDTGTEDALTVAIVGGGVSGLVLAIALARKGVCVRIFEATVRRM